LLSLSRQHNEFTDGGSSTYPLP